MMNEGETDCARRTNGLATQDKPISQYVDSIIHSPSHSYVCICERTVLISLFSGSLLMYLLCVEMTGFNFLVVFLSFFI
jgi:hypothetical protein